MSENAVLNNGGPWSVNLEQAVAEHESGFRLAFSGHPGSRNFDIQPSGVPGDMGALEWARLLRQGTDLYRAAFGDEPATHENDRPARNGPSRKPVITVKRRRQVEP